MAANQAQWIGTPSIKGKSEATRMALLTFSLVGLQFTWGMEMTYCTPYLLQLGMTKSKLSLVWIAGPLSGLVMQPIVGILADKSKSKYGRRRPYMVGGSIVVAVCLFILGWAGEITGIFVSGKELKRELTIALAVLAIYALDFAINVVQATCRSLIVDTLPISKQQLGSAWASRMVAVGHLVGYGVGAINLENVFGNVLGDTQFKRVIVIAAFALLFAVGLTSWAVNERVLISDGTELGNTGNAITSTISTIVRTTLHLPPRIQRVCNIQFWAWIAWFPFLFYSSTWVGETYMRHDAPPEVRNSPDSLSIIGIVGSRTLILFSCITFAGSVLLPYLVQKPEDTYTRGHSRTSSTSTSSSGPSRGGARTPSTFTRRPPAFLAPVAAHLPSITKPSLLTAWLASHLLFAATIFFAPLVSSVHAASLIVALCGLPWALASWAPFTYMGVEINRLGSSSNHFSSSSSSTSRPVTPSSSTYGRAERGLLGSLLAQPDGDVDGEDAASATEMMHLSGGGGSGGRHRSATDAELDSQPAQLAGIYLGILNLYTTLPQFVASGISTVVFAVFEPGKDEDVEGGKGSAGSRLGGGGVSGIAICLFVGAWASLVAAWCTRRLVRNYS